MVSLKEFLSEESISKEVKGLKVGDDVSYYKGEGSSHLFKGKIKKVTKDAFIIILDPTKDIVNVRKIDLVLDK